MQHCHHGSLREAYHEPEPLDRDRDRDRDHDPDPNHDPDSDHDTDPDRDRNRDTDPDRDRDRDPDPTSREASCRTAAVMARSVSKRSTTLHTSVRRASRSQRAREILMMKTIAIQDQSPIVLQTSGCQTSTMTVDLNWWG